MEAPLGVHEFLKRYHLPQLVRLHLDNQEQQDYNEPRQVISTSSSKCFKNAAKPHEKSDWTYRAGSGGSVCASSRSQLELNCRTELSEDEDLNGGFRSLFIGSSGATQEPFRVPRASLARPSFQKVEATKKTAEPPSREQRQAALSQIGGRIKLAPTIRWPATAKLQLEQPFLLYKAFKKIELCAYVIDASNELSEKSGDPIYFPHNYTGWFSLQNQNQQPLDSVELVCRQGAKLFMTRDQIAGYQLPSRLSNLTKLGNDQLLAMPLAINLDRAQNNCGSENSDELSDIRQVVIGAGQVLKVCGVYEDMLPLIESSKAYPSTSSYIELPSWSQANGQMYEYQLHQQVAIPTGQDKLYEQIYRQQVDAYSRQQQVSTNKKLLRLRPHQWGQGSMLDQGEQYAPKPVIYKTPSVQQVLVPPKGKAKTKSSKKNPAIDNQPSALGRRYARCILLSQRSVDRLTETPVGSTRATTDQTTQSTCGDGKQEVEVEVLIPLDQRGRFYLCANNQSLLNELYSCGCHQAAIVYRLSQIVSLVSLSRHLDVRTSQQQQQHQPQARRSHQQAKSKFTCYSQKRRLALPLQLQLVIGPRPSNFSPSMFGTSSTMSSYFSCGVNVGGHALRCPLNKNQSVETGACQCAEELHYPAGEPPSGQLSLFSAQLLVERIARRDVLLACTIKSDPLVHLDPFKTDQQTGGSQQRQRTAMLAIQSACIRLGGKHSTIGGPSSRAALEPTTTKQQEASQDKSTFGRLKACRSLISLNGRRRRRPKLAGMFSAGGFDSGSLGGAKSAESRPPWPANLQQLETTESGNQIVMVEFDCSQQTEGEQDQVRFIRTFVESSIPSSSIPELVLNRMEYCRRNSVAWERQLKLSYQTLSQDFDAWQRQMELGADEERRLSPARPPSSAMGGHQVAASSTASSTASSSRSSSGVSSAGAHEKQKPRAGSPSRLSRLVHKILPGGQTQRQLVLEELQRSLWTREGATGTLMNAQKIHKKLMSSSPSGTDEPAELEPGGGGQRAKGHQLSLSSLSSGSSNSSHLYESLERLQSCKRGLRASIWPQEEPNKLKDDQEAQWWHKSTGDEQAGSSPVAAKKASRRESTSAAGWFSAAARQLKQPPATTSGAGGQQVSDCGKKNKSLAVRQLSDDGRPSGSWRDGQEPVRPSTSSQYLDDYGMEPVSIEAFTEIGALLIDEQSDQTSQHEDVNSAEPPRRPTSRQSGRASACGLRPLPVDVEQDYVNLPAGKSRMERKLARLRGRQRAGRQDLAAWRSQFDLASCSAAQNRADEPKPSKLVQATSTSDVPKADQLDGPASTNSSSSSRHSWRLNYFEPVAQQGTVRSSSNSRLLGDQTQVGRRAQTRVDWSSVSSTGTSAGEDPAAIAGGSSSSSGAGSWRALSPARLASGRLAAIELVLDRRRPSSGQKKQQLQLAQQQRRARSPVGQATVAQVEPDKSQRLATLDRLPTSSSQTTLLGL